MVSGVMRRSWAERHWVWSRNFFGDIFATPKETPPQWMLLGIFLLLAGVYWGVHYQPYILPNSDFFRIQEMAAQLMSGKMPDDLRQMPLVPILMVPFALFLPVEENIYLHAISVLNIVLSLGSLALLYFLARVFLGSALAFIPVLLLLAAPQFTVSAHQPMLEPAIGFFSLATFLALARRSGWAYVFAGLCALARYEMAALLAVVFVVECFRAPRQWFAIGLKCTLAGLPFLIWFALSMLLPAGGNQYIDEVVRAPLESVVMNMKSPYPMPTEMQALFIALAWTLGAYAAFRRNPSLALGVVCFVLLYTAAHFVYGRPLPRYSYPLLWTLPLFATIAFHVLFRLVRPLAERMNAWALGAAGLALAAAFVFLGLRSLDLFSQGFPSAAIASESWYLGWSVIVLGAAFAVVVFSTKLPVQQRALAAVGTLVVVCVPIILGGGSLARAAAAVHYEKAEVVVAAEWLAQNLDEDDAAVMSRYYDLPDGMPSIDPDRVVFYEDFTADSHGGFIQELDAKGIEYVVFTYRPKRPTDPSSPLYGRNVDKYLSGKIYLMDPFRFGEQAEGFRKVATLPPTHPDYNHPTHIYQRSPTYTESFEAKNNDER